MKPLGIFFAAASVAAIGSFVSQAKAADDANLVSRGEYLARMGDCAACHTKTGGEPLAGGDAINSPFGAIYPPNITPDKATGIGDWSEDDFYRAMHDGIGKHGEYLYPAFPYLWFTKITRDDVHAIKAYLNTVKPVDAKSRQTRLMFPFDLRIGVGGWDAAFLKAGEFKPDPSKSDEWNRGAYIVEGLGHCGDCHTPKGTAMEPIESKAFSGGAVDKWYAPDITSDKQHGVGGWADKDLATYLKTGSAPGRGAAVGPMAQVVRDSLSYLTDADINAIVAFLKATPAISDYKAVPKADVAEIRARGAQSYLTHCAYCHQPDGKGRSGAVPALDGNGVVQAKGPEDVIRVVLGGLLATGPYAPMPAVGADMSDQEIADVVDYVRGAWSNRAPPAKENGIVGKIRAETHTALSGPWSAQKDPCRTGPNDPAIKPLDDPESKIDQTLSAMTAETMSPSIDQSIAQIRQLEPGASQSDIVDGLVLAYCRVEAKRGGLKDEERRRELTRFSQLAYTQVTSDGKD